MNDNDAPLPPDELGDRVSEVFDLIGALYRRGLRKLEQAEKEEGVSVGVRSVLVLLRR
ncbi:MAG: MarR family transcriptional regulator, partial [Streptomyces sp.]|nr:MarR family transcriptional regulator [Streptomyces sp.]